MELREWVRLFLKHHDLIKQEIERIDDTEWGFSVRKKDYTEEWVIGDMAEAVTHLHSRKRQGIVCRNTRENFEFLLRHWNDFALYPSLKVVFANPKANERWIVVPHYHARVSDDKSFKQGLETMFASIPTC